jgi:hypothetical protein
MKPVCVGEEEDGFFKLGDFIIHLVLLDVWLEVRQVVDSTLAMGSCEDVSRILAYILRDFAPSGFHC